nr:MAG TPA: hypothetical protein [Caudoviricetes sp.]
MNTILFSHPNVIYGLLLLSLSRGLYLWFLFWEK